jgi:small redox-active disulfide protein 2
MGKDIIQIRIGQRQVGLIGLTEIFKEVQKLDLKGPGVIAAELTRRASKLNYVPPAAQANYGQAILLEYRRFLGEKVEEDHASLEIRVLGQGCYRCEELMQRVISVVAELKIPADVQHIRDIRQIASYGIIPTPALVINGKIVVAGKLPSVKEIMAMLSPGQLSDK